MGAEQLAPARGLALVPFHFWSAMFFALGCVAGSFLNVCIYRLPRGLSIVWPPSHCTSCQYTIPWYLNIPLISWLVLRGRCRNCAAPISIRYFAVELLTGLAFMLSWVMYGRQSVWLVIVYCVVLSGLIVASFIDIEHLIIPDVITLGGACLGIACSILEPTRCRVRRGGDTGHTAFWEACVWSRAHSSAA
ncbi:MAG: prepilin peptidase [Verrucomicrobiae bacterium]|nr:prepilin peptidase [Verrucomicrobiae bacterium]